MRSKFLLLSGLRFLLTAEKELNELVVHGSPGELHLAGVLKGAISGEIRVGRLESVSRSSLCLNLAGIGVLSSKGSVHVPCVEGAKCFTLVWQQHGAGQSSSKKSHLLKLNFDYWLVN